MIEKQDYPISVAEEISSLLKYFYSSEYKYSNTLEIIFPDIINLVEIRGKENPQYKFKVSRPKQGGDKKTYFTVTKIPKNVNSNEEISSSVLLIDIPSHFTGWTNLLERHNAISFEKEDLYSKEEENQFYKEFKIEGEEADTNPLLIENQIKVFELLEELQKRLGAHGELNPDVEEIIKDTEDLKNDLRSLPKSVVGKRIAKLQVRIKKIGIRFFLDIVDVAYKESIKFALRGGIDGIQHILS